MKRLIWGSGSERIGAENVTGDGVPPILTNTGIPIRKGLENISGISRVQALRARKDLLRCGSWTPEEKKIPTQCNLLPPKAFVNPSSY